MAKRQPNEADLRAAKRLKLAVAKSKDLDPSLTQEEIANRIGVTQSGVGHYLNGRTPLNLDALFAICSVINANPALIYPELVSTKIFGDTDSLAEFLSAYAVLDPKTREHFLELMKATHRDKTSSDE